MPFLFYTIWIFPSYLSTLFDTFCVFHEDNDQNVDIHCHGNEQHGHCYRHLLAAVRTHSSPVSDGFCIIIGRCRINDEPAHFPPEANYKLVIVSIWYIAVIWLSDAFCAEIFLYHWPLRKVLQQEPNSKASVFVFVQVWLAVTRRCSNWHLSNSV